MTVTLVVSMIMRSRAIVRVQNLIGVKALANAAGQEIGADFS